MNPERGIVLVGMELEVPGWEGRTYQSVATDLIKEEYMYGPSELWNKWHKYHCDCEEGGCKHIRYGSILDIPIVSMTYDGSLPEDGAEFVTTPVYLSLPSSLDQLHDIWEIVTRDAIWDRGPNVHSIHGGKVSPSIHFHVSCTPVEPLNEPKKMSSVMRETYRRLYVDDVFSVLCSFSPELFLLADNDSYRRGINFRWPTRLQAMSDQKHHAFADIRKATPYQELYIEWRIFEIANSSWSHLLGGLFLVAALTRALVNPQFLSELVVVGSGNPYSEVELAAVTTAEEIYSFVDINRLTFLRDICLKELSDNTFGASLVRDMFDHCMGKVG